MNIKKIVISVLAGFLALLFLLMFVLLPVLNVNADEAKTTFTCTTADEWTALFDRRGVSQRGWLGADGIFTVALDGDDSFASADKDTVTMFIFSDTLTGTSDANGRITGMRMPNHSSAILKSSAPDPDNLTFVTGKGGNGRLNQNIFTDARLWLLDCFVTGGSAYVFGFEPTNDWKPQQTELFKIPIKDGTADYSKSSSMGQIPQLFYRDSQYIYDFGMGVMCNTESARAPLPDGYIYIYGYRDALKEFSRKDLIVSRIRESDFPNFDKLEYYTENGWGKDIKDCTVLVSAVSCEVSVSPIEKGPYRGKYIAVYTKWTEGSEICYSVGDSPVGPFDTPVTFYNTPEHGTTGDDGVSTRYTYNAKAHPHLSEGTKLLVSYNVNIRNGEQYTTDYHPRFLWLDLDPNNEGDAEVEGIVSYGEKAKTPSEAQPEQIDSEKPPVTLLIVAGIVIAAAAVCAVVIVIARCKKA